MVVQKIFQEIIKQGLKYGPGLVKAEGKVLNYAYKGYKHKGAITSGIRSGLFTGAVVGTQLNTADVPEIYVPPERGRNGNSPGSEDKTRNRRFGNRKRYTKYCTPNRGVRHSYSRKRYNRNYRR